MELLLAGGILRTKEEMIFNKLLEYGSEIFQFATLVFVSLICDAT